MRAPSWVDSVSFALIRSAHALDDALQWLVEPLEWPRWLRRAYLLLLPLAVLLHALTFVVLLIALGIAYAGATFIEMW